MFSTSFTIPPLAEKTATFEKLLSEGKVSEAQRAAYLKNDVTELLKNATAGKFNLNEQGGGGNSNEITDQDKAIDKLNELAEKKVSDKKVSFGIAMTEVCNENPDLAKVAKGSQAA